MDVLPVDTVEQHGQLRSTQADAALVGLGCGEAKRALFQTLVDNHIAVLIPVQQLDPVAAAVAKDEDVSGERLGLQVLPHELRQRVKAFAQIGRLNAQPNTHGRRKTQHGVCSSSTASSCRSVTASKPLATRNRRPLARITSRAPSWQAFSVSSRTGTKAACSASRSARMRRQR